MAFDKLTTQDLSPATLPANVPLDVQTQTDGGQIQVLKIADGVKDSLNLLGVNATGEASTIDATARATLASILATLTADPATQTTLAAILAKITSDPATQTTVAAILAAVTGTLAVSAVALPLPSGAATAANQGTEISGLAAILSDADAILAKLSSDPATQTTLAAVLAKLSSDPATQTTLAAILAKMTSDPATQTTLASVLTKLNASIAVTGTFFQATQPVSATALPLPTGASTETTLASVLAKIVAAPALDASVTALVPTTDFDSKIGGLTETAPATDTASSGLNGRLQRIAQRISSFIALFTFGSHGVIVEGNASGTPIPITGSISVGAATSGTVTQSSVAGSASSVSLLASNSSRKGAALFNDSTAMLYVRLDASAATNANFTVELCPGAYYEVPFGYTGEIRGIWASAVGNARVSEWT